MYLTNKQKELILEALETLKIQSPQAEKEHEITELDGLIRYADKIASINTYETIVDKYDILTCDKEDSLGETMTLKEALDLYWNRIDFTLKQNGVIQEFSAYKSCDGSYQIWEQTTDDCYNNDAELLNKKITLDYDYCDDCDGLPIVSAEIVKEA